MSDRPLIVLEGLAARAKPTGVAGAIEDLTAALAARDRGFEYLLVVERHERFAWLADVPHWRVVQLAAGSRPARRQWFLQRDLPVLCRRNSAAALHCLRPTAPVWPGCPLVVTVHDLAWRLLPGVVPPLRRLYYDLTIPPTLRRAALLLASSQATARDLAVQFPTLAARVRVTPLGTPGWVSRTASSAAPRGSERPFFLFVGTLEPRKNLPRLLTAYADLLALRDGDVPDLLLVGPAGWADGPLRALLTRADLRERVDVRGYCDRAELRGLYGAATALVFPSLLEGFGLPVLEAMACGLPVLTADRGATAEVAGAAALLVDPADTAALTAALARLAHDATLRAHLAAAGRERAQQWTWERTADLTTAAYAELTRGGPARK